MMLTLEAENLACRLTLGAVPPLLCILRFSLLSMFVFKWNSIGNHNPPPSPLYEHLKKTPPPSGCNMSCGLSAKHAKCEEDVVKHSMHRCVSPRAKNGPRAHASGGPCSDVCCQLPFHVSMPFLYVVVYTTVVFAYYTLRGADICSAASTLALQATKLHFSPCCYRPPPFAKSHPLPSPPPPGRPSLPCFPS